MEIKQVNWQTVLPIRHQVLWPDKPVSFCKVLGDETADHFGAILPSGELVSVASIYEKRGEVQLRKFATVAAYQGQGIGTTLLKYLISQSKQRGAKIFWCDARANSTRIYSKQGLQIDGEQFEKYGQPYYRMQVVL